jgi:hypothetical protein
MLKKTLEIYFVFPYYSFDDDNMKGSLSSPKGPIKVKSNERSGFKKIAQFIFAINILFVAIDIYMFLYEM